MNTITALELQINPDEPRTSFAMPDVLPKLHRRAQILFNKLLDIRKDNGTVSLSLRDLSTMIGYSYSSVRLAMQELQRVNLAKRLHRGRGHAPSTYFVNWGFDPYNAKISLRNKDNQKPHKYGVCAFSVHPHPKSDNKSSKDVHHAGDPKRIAEKTPHNDEETLQDDDENAGILTQRDKRYLSVRIRAALPEEQRGLANAICNLIWHHRHTTFRVWLRVISDLEVCSRVKGVCLDGPELSENAVWYVRRAIKTMRDDKDSTFGRSIYEAHLQDRRLFLVKSLETVEQREAGRDAKAHWYVRQVQETGRCPHCGSELTMNAIPAHFCYRWYEDLRVELHDDLKRLDRELAALPNPASRGDCKACSVEDFILATDEYLATQATPPASVSRQEHTPNPGEKSGYQRLQAERAKAADGLSELLRDEGVGSVSQLIRQQVATDGAAARMTVKNKIHDGGDNLERISPDATGQTKDS